MLEGLLKKNVTSKPPAQKTRPKVEQRVTVHLVSHTHADVGWVKTIDEYYSGFEGKRSHSRLEQILD
jgi:hypothetical protein